MSCVQTGKSMETVVDSWLGGGELGGKWRLSLNGYEGSSCDNENVLKFIEVMVV